MIQVIRYRGGEVILDSPPKSRVRRIYKKKKLTAFGNSSHPPQAAPNPHTAASGQQPENFRPSEVPEALTRLPW